MESAGRELERARRNGQPVAVALMDLDHFKLVNDEYGHQAGDSLLHAVARACVGSLRATA